MNPLWHYATVGWQEGRHPHPLFDTSFYLEHNPDVAQAGVNPLWHYATVGWQEGRNPHPLFDTSFYLEHNPDVAQAGVNPLWHYATVGWQEGRNPNALFDSALSGTPLQKLNLAEVVFSHVVEPIVSIIVAIGNDNQRYNCLQSIRAHTDAALPYEVLVVDNAGTDEVGAMLRSVREIQIIRYSKDREFLHALDMAAANARGRYLVFLSSNTEVQPGWLQAMHDVYQHFNQVAVVCPKLLDPNGRIREAGIIMRRDGTAYPYGKGASVDDYLCNYVKEIDCATGTCLMIDQEAYIALGGFDTQFTEAGGYAAFDFAFAARKSGWKVYYQPKAEIIHFSHSEANSQSQERQCFINKWKFRAKWIEQLMEQAGSEDDYFRARDYSSHRKIILVVDHMVPHYDTNAGDFMVYLYLQLLVEMGFKVMFLPHNRCAPQPYTEQLQQRGIEVIHGPVDFSKWIAQHGDRLDYVWLARPDIAGDLGNLVLDFSDAKLLYFTRIDTLNRQALANQS